MARIGIAGLIVAGGGARRLRADKPFVGFGNRSLLDTVIARVEPQVDRLAINLSAASHARFHATHPTKFDLLVDAFDAERGPLGGVLAGLDWIASEDASGWLATFPCDTPFLPGDLVALLSSARTPEPRPVVALCVGRQHFLCALWPASLRDRLHAGVLSFELRSVESALDAFGAVRCPFDTNAEAFFNINTESDLSLARRIAGIDLGPP